MLPSGWKNRKLGDLLDFKNGMNTDKSQYGSGQKFVNVMDVFNNDEIDNNKIIGRVNASEKQLSNYKIKYGDILFNRTSEVFDEIAMSAVYIDNGLATFGGFVIRGRPITKELNVSFCIYLFQSQNFRKQAIRMGQGAIRSNIGQKDLAKIEIQYPPLQEQKKIAKILSTWDKAINTTQKLIDNSQQQKKALMQQLLTGKRRMLDDLGKPFEGKWEELSVVSFGKVVTGSTPPKNDASNYGNHISWATAEDFKQKYVSNTNVKLTESGASKARIVPKGSVLVTCIASIGKNAIANEALSTNQQINSVIINNKNSNEYFYYLIEFNKHKLLAWAGTTAVPILNKTSFEKIKFKAPAKVEQQKVAAVIINADKEIELLQKQLDDLNQEKKALMQQLLTGKKRVTTNGSAGGSPA